MSRESQDFALLNEGADRGAVIYAAKAIEIFLAVTPVLPCIDVKAPRALLKAAAVQGKA